LKPSNFPNEFNPDAGALWPAEVIDVFTLFALAEFARYGSGPLPPHAVKRIAAQVGANMDVKTLVILVAVFNSVPSFQERFIDDGRRSHAARSEIFTAQRFLKD
jgi:hypothetical protein